MLFPGGYADDGAVIKQEPDCSEEPTFFLPWVNNSRPHSLESSLPFIDLTGDAIMAGVADAFTYTPPRPVASQHDEQERLEDAYILHKMLNDGPPGMSPASTCPSASPMASPVATSDTRVFQGRHRQPQLTKMMAFPSLTPRMLSSPRPAPGTPISSLLAGNLMCDSPSSTRMLAPLRLAPATPISSLLGADSPMNSPHVFGGKPMKPSMMPPLHLTPATASPVSSPRSPPAKICRVPSCTEPARSSGRCEKHTTTRYCSAPGCTKNTQSNGKCIRHGGGKRCEVEGCPRGAQARGKCKTHGGGVRCKAPDCYRSSQGSGLCRTHGGGKLCDYPGCKKGTQRHGKCSTHGGSRRCRVDGCEKVDRGGGYCGRHKSELSSKTD